MPIEELPVAGSVPLRARDYLRADVERNLEQSATTYGVLANVLWSRGVQAVVIYRLSHWAWQCRLVVMSEVLKRLNQLLFGVDIAYQAEIGPGFALRHPFDVVVGIGSRIGSGVCLYNGVSIGNRLSGTTDRPDGAPTLGDGVLVGTGAKLLGPITIGADSMIGANAVVTFSVPPNSRVVGPKSRIL